MAKNFWPRITGANLAAAFFLAPHNGVWWVDFLAHCIVMLALMLLTSPEKTQ